MSLRSTTLPSARQTYCCFRRDRSSRCSILNEMPELRAPENSFTGIEIKPNVRYPDQTEAAIVHPVNWERAQDSCAFSPSGLRELCGRFSATSALKRYSSEEADRSQLPPPRSSRASELKLQPKGLMHKARAGIPE